jgi:hypothetical protein
MDPATSNLSGDANRVPIGWRPGVEGAARVILVLFLVLALALVPVGGGRLRALSSLRFRAPWLLWLALAAQVVLIAFPGQESWWRTAANVATFPLGLAFVWWNRRIPGLWLVGVGALLNLLPILANGGVMPASAHALALAGIPAHLGIYANSAVLAEPRLLFLGDVIAIPESVPLANVLSVGDVLIALGAAYTVHRVTGSGLAGPRGPASA